jgi:hypothetical protein
MSRGGPARNGDSKLQIFRAGEISAKVQPLFRLQEKNLKGEFQRKVDTNGENVERKTFQRTLQPFLQLQKTSRSVNVRKVGLNPEISRPEGSEARMQPLLQLQR